MAGLQVLKGDLKPLDFYSLQSLRKLLVDFTVFDSGHSILFNCPLAVHEEMAWVNYAHDLEDLDSYEICCFGCDPETWEAEFKAWLNSQNEGKSSITPVLPIEDKQ